MSTRGTLLALTGLTGDSEGQWFDVPADGRERIAMQSSVSSGTATVVFEGRITADDLPVLLKTIVGSGAYYGPKMPQMRARVTDADAASVHVSINAVLTPLSVGTPDGDGGTMDAGSSGLATLPDLGTPGTYGDTTLSPQITVDAKGRITSVVNKIIAALFRGNVADDTARNATPSLSDGVLVFNQQRQRLERYSGTVGAWKNAADTAMGTFSPLQYGAKFDYNPTTGLGTDDTQAFLDCIAAIKAAQLDSADGGGTLLMPRGHALVTSVVFENMSGVTVRGAGPYSTRLHAKNTATGGAVATVSDTFTASGLDTTKWNTKLSGPSGGTKTITQTGDGYVTFTETGGNFGPIQINSKLPADFSIAGTECWLKPGPTQDGLALEISGGAIVNGRDDLNDGTYQLKREGGNLIARYWTSTSTRDVPTTLATVSVTAAVAVYWRIRRSLTGTLIEFQYSTDDVTYTTLATMAPISSGLNHALMYTWIGREYFYAVPTTSVQADQWAIRQAAYDQSKPVIDVRSCRYMNFRDFSVDGGIADKARVACIRLGNLATGRTVTATSNRFSHVIANFGQRGWFWQGPQHLSSNPANALAPYGNYGDDLFTDQNNDLTTLYACGAFAYIRAGYHIAHSQCKHNRFYSCEFNGGFNGEDAKRDNYQTGVLNTRGSYRFFNGGGGYNAGADFTISEANDNIVIEGNDSEGANRFVRIGVDYVPGANDTTVATLASLGSTIAVSILRNRIADNNHNADGNVIVDAHAGPTTIEGNTFEFSTRTPKVLLDGTGWQRVRFVGNEFTGGVGGTIPDNGANWSPIARGTLGGNGYSAVIDSNAFRGNTRPNPPTNGTAFYPRQSEQYRTNNTAATTISTIGNAHPGMKISILACDALTTIQHNAGVRLAGGVDFTMALGSVLFLEACYNPSDVTDRGYLWREVSRSTV